MDFPRKQWRDPKVAADTAGELSKQLNVPRAVAEILAGRGIADASSADDFLHPRLSSLSDPFGLSGMREAVDCIWEALDKKRKIAVFGDYDVDGLTSSALLVGVLGKLGADVDPFIPERALDGYGMSIPPLKRCIDQCGPDLIVSVDCGTNAVDAVEYAKSLGVDVIVTDHHEPHDSVAPALALVNPKVSGDKDSMDLAGVGVAFRLCHGLIKDGLEKQRGEVADIDLRDWLDFVAVGTVADIVPLRGDNRTLVRYGLSRLNAQLSGGKGKLCWQAIADSAGLKGAVEPYHVGFVIGPRLNAAGRMGSAESALELLLADDASQAASRAGYLEKTNRDRRELEASIRAEAEKKIDAYFNEESDYGIVVWDRGWHMGINGIVASRLTAKYGRPVVVITLDAEGKGTGSSRSIECMDILGVLDGCSDLLVAYGGHKMAAGLEVNEADLDEFKRMFNDLCAERLKGVDLRAVLGVDAWVTLGELDELLITSLKDLEPYGMENPAPLLGVRGVSVAGPPKKIGKTEDHLKMVLAAGGEQMEAVGFGLGPYEVPEGKLDVVFRLRENTFRGRTMLQLHIQDMRKSTLL